MEIKKHFPRFKRIFTLLALFVTGAIFATFASSVVSASDTHTHDKWTAWSDASSLPSKPGQYYLTTDVVIDIHAVEHPRITKTKSRINPDGTIEDYRPYEGIGWTIPEGVTELCLNGKTITINPANISLPYTVNGEIFWHHVAIMFPSLGYSSLVLWDETGEGKIDSELPIFLENGDFNMNGGTIHSAYVSGKGRFFFNDGMIMATENTYTDNFSNIDGANTGVRTTGTGFFRMNGGRIENCAYLGVDAAGSYTAIINDGVITGNEMGIRGNITMNGGTISNNDKYGVYVNNKTFTMNGGKISNNTLDGVFSNSGKFIMNDGTIKDNGRHGVYNYATSATSNNTFTMNGGEISDNLATGVYNEITFKMTGGTIDNNRNYGVYAANGKIELSGSINIFYNGRGNNLVITPQVGTINITDAIDGEVWVKLLNDLYEPKSGVFTTSTSVNASDYSSAFRADDSRFFFVTTSDNELAIDIFPHYHYGETYYAWEDRTTLPTQGGNYFLWYDVTISESWVIPDNTIIQLCLNGHTISGVGVEEAVIIVDGKYAQLRILDEEETGTITTENEELESVIKVSKGTIMINNATLSGQANKGLTLIDNSIAFIHPGTYISGFKEYGIYIDGSFLNEDGVVVTNNGKYGIYANTPTYLKLSGATITNNNEGGVYSNGRINVSNVLVVTDNGENVTRNIVLGNVDTSIIVDSALGEGANLGVTMLDSNGDDVYGKTFSTATTYVNYFSADNPAYRVIIEYQYLKIAKFNDILVSDMQNGHVSVVNEAEVAKTVTINVNADVGYQLENLSVMAGEASLDLTVNNPRLQYSFTMPDNNVTIIATFESKGTIVYQKWDVTQGKFISTELESDYLLLTNGSTITNNEIGTGATNPYEWVVVEGNNVDFGEKILKVKGNVNLILKDGSYLQVRGAFEVSDGNSLTIYGQAQGTGRLFARNQTNGYSAIGGQQGADGGNVTIHGGIIEAKGADTGIGGSGTGHNGGNVTIYGGFVKASGTYAGIGASNNGTFNGALTIPDGYVIFGGDSSLDRNILDDYTTARFKHMTIQKVTTIDVSANDIDINYLDEAPAAYSYVSKINNEDVSDNDLVSAIANKIAIDCDYVKNDDAGKYSIEVLIEDGNIFFVGFEGSTPYKVSNAIDGTLTVNRIDPAITFLPSKIQNLVFSGEEQNLINGGVTPDGTYKYKIDGGEYLTTLPSATKPGIYTIYYKVFGDKNHNDSLDQSLEVTIVKATLSDVSVIQNGTLIYNGMNQLATVKESATSVGDENVVFTYSETIDGEYKNVLPVFSDVGAHTVYYKATAPNHNDAFGTFDIVIEKANPILLTVPTKIENLKYLGIPQVLINEGEVNVGTLMYKLDDGDYSLNIPSASLVGVYVVYYKVVGNESYNNLEEEAIVVDIFENDKSELSLVMESTNEYYNSIKDDFVTIAQALKTEIDKANLVYENKNVTESKIDSTIVSLRLALNECKIDVVNEKINIIISKINDIGNVIYTNECKEKINDARAYYDTLTPSQKESVSNYSILVAAEGKYQTLESNHAAANIVKAHINSIGEITYVGIHNRKIESVRNEYNLLSEERKALVTNYQILLDAEASYAALKLENEVEKIDNKETGVSVSASNGKAIPKNITLQVEIKDSVKEEQTGDKLERINSKLGANERIIKVYDIKLVNGNSEEIQPSDIEEGMSITVKIALPNDISRGNLKILHIHSSENIKYIDNYDINGNELSFSVDKLSEFAFIVLDSELPAWAVTLIVICSLLLVGVLFTTAFIIVKKERKAKRVLKSGI